MLTRFMKALAARAADDARALQRRYLPADAVAHVAEASARALTRHWPAAHALAELTAARHARSIPHPPAPGAPLRVLVAARLGAIGPAEEATALGLLAALERAAGQPRARAIEVTLCGTRRLTDPTAPAAALAARIFGHRVLDATGISAAEVGAWVDGADIVFTCNDLSPSVAGQADVELAALALGFARARGIPALAFGVVSPAERAGAEALGFIQRFASKAQLFCATPEVASSFIAAGLRAEGPAAVASPLAEPSGEAVVLFDAAPGDGGVGLGNSLLGETFTLGALLLGARGSTLPRDPTPSSVDAAAAARGLEAAGHRVRRVHLGAAPPAGAEALTTGDALIRHLAGLPPRTRVLCLAPAALPHVLAAGHLPIAPTPPHAVLPVFALLSPSLAVQRLIDAASPPVVPRALPNAKPAEGAGEGGGA
jgi:hypothetical protein